MHEAPKKKKLAKKSVATTKVRIEDINKVKFKYLFPDNYNPLYANGAHGGLTPRGEIAINFFLERNPIPYVDTHAVLNGQIGDLLQREPQMQEHEAAIVRYITTGVIMTPETARRVKDFIEMHLSALEAENLPRQ